MKNNILPFIIMKQKSLETVKARTGQNKTGSSFLVGTPYIQDDITVLT